MFRRNSVNINELINRFEVSNEDDFGMSENVKYVKVSRPLGKMYTVHDDDNSFGDIIDDKNRSLMKYNENDKYFNYKTYTKRTNINMGNAKEITKHTITIILQRISGLLEIISKFPFPRMSVMSFGLTTLLAIFICPRNFASNVLYPGFRILFSVVYPAYRSFKAIRNKNLKEYLKWLAYWVVFAFLTIIELLTDAMLSWFPFYYEIKVILWIWLLGPSTKGSMKLYKTFVHPTLISREQDIDDIIQIAQERGYMHVFQIGSKSVNYANKIIMQDAKTPVTDNNFIVSHQLTRNISLSSVSDTETIQSIDDVDEILRLRRYAAGKIPIYGTPMNFPYEHIEQRRKPSADFRYDDISSGYASPDSTSYFRQLPPPPQRTQHAYIEENEDDREMYYRNLSRNRAHSMQSEMGKSIAAKDVDRFENSQRDVSCRKPSINELSEDEIIFAYNNLKMQSDSNEYRVDEKVQDENLSKKIEENFNEFQKWMETRETDASRIDVKSNDIPNEKVNELNETVDAINVVQSENENPPTDTYETEIFVDFDEFQDAISDDDTTDEYLNVPLVILEEDDNDVKTEHADESSLIQNETSSICDENLLMNIESPMIPTVIETNIEKKPLELHAEDENTVVAKMTLSNAPLQVVTNLSASNFSLASDKSSDDASKKRRAKHAKGPAPPPPTSSVPANVIPGHFYDQITKKQFKETEL